MSMRPASQFSLPKNPQPVVGLHVEGNTLRLHPCLPPQWDVYSISYRFRTTLYRIQVLRVADDDASPAWTVDGLALDSTCLSLLDDGAEHTVIFRLALPQPAPN